MSDHILWAINRISEIFRTASPFNEDGTLKETAKFVFDREPSDPPVTQEDVCDLCERIWGRLFLHTCDRYDMDRGRSVRYCDDCVEEHNLGCDECYKHWHEKTEPEDFDR